MYFGIDTVVGVMLIIVVPKALGVF